MTRAIILHLGNADPVMKQLIAAAGSYAREPQEERSPFETLARAIAHQQLNGKAAQSILNRFISTCGKGVFPDRPPLLALKDAQLRASGFSFSKIAALRDLAAKTLSGVVPTLEELHTLSDAVIIERLTQVRGVGRWTVQMMLMSHLRRPDVLPVDDFGVRHGFPTGLRVQEDAASEGARDVWRALGATAQRSGLVPVARGGSVSFGSAAVAGRGLEAAASAAQGQGQTASGRRTRCRANSNASQLPQLDQYDRVLQTRGIVAPQHRDLAHQRRRNERELFLRREEHGLNVAREVAVHVRQLKFDSKSRHGAQATDDHRQSYLRRANST